MEQEIGTIEVGKYADMIIMKENPLKNLKYLYGTVGMCGYMKLKN